MSKLSHRRERYSGGDVRGSDKHVLMSILLPHALVSAFFLVAMTGVIVFFKVLLWVLGE